jgi:acetylornithine deacetylase/succinyl-diaminopimelate desuccinylase-like protein
VREAAEGLATVDVLVETTAIASPETGPLPDACAAVVAEVDPGAVVAPYVCPAGTDAQRLAPLGIRGYGFAPLVLPDGFDAVALWHARDERVPVDSIRRGHEVLRRIALRY